MLQPRSLDRKRGNRRQMIMQGDNVIMLLGHEGSHAQTVVKSYGNTGGKDTVAHTEPVYRPDRIYIQIKCMYTYGFCRRSRKLVMGHLGTRTEASL